MGYGTGGLRQKRCARTSCGQLALRRSDYCRHHDVAWQRERMEQLRKGTGKPMSIAENIKLLRANVQRLWWRAPWSPLATIWLSPPLEARFAGDCHGAGLQLPEIAPVVSNNLRWAWARSLLNHHDEAGWARSLAAARKRQAEIGSMPVGYIYAAPPDTPPGGMLIKTVTRRAISWEPAARNPLVDRTTRAQERKRQSRQRQPSWKRLDLAAFIAEHGPALAPAFRACGLVPGDVDAPTGRQLALAWRDVLDEQEHLGDQSGPFYRRWRRLLRDLKS